MRIKPLLFLLLLIATKLQGQNMGMAFTHPHQEVTIPFHYENHFMVVEVLYENFLPLKFIFDTGAEHSILVKREVADLLGTKYERQMNIIGADMRSELIAYVARRVKLKISGVSFQQDLLVLKDDYFHFDEYAGAQVHGILGASLFSGMVVSINYMKQTITVSNADYFKGASKSFHCMDVDIWHNKAYTSVPIRLHNDSIVLARLLIDTGAGLSLLLHTGTSTGITIPPRTINATIGLGLGGTLSGILGRCKSMELAGFRFDNLVSNFQDISYVQDTSLILNRDGIIGNDILNRFYVIIDFARGKLYLQPNRDFHKTIEFDKSGLSFLATGPDFKTFIVNDVVEGSPAALAGIQKGDVLRKLNGWPSYLYTLNGIQDKLSGKVGKHIYLRLLRNGQSIKKRFILSELI